MNQVEHIWLITRVCPKLTKQPNVHFPGSTSGDSLYGVGIPDANDGWVLQHKDKKTLLGDSGMPLPGGKTEGIAPKDDAAKKARKTDQTWVPMTYHANHSHLYDELIHRASATVCIYDLTCLDGVLAHVAIENNTPYLGLVWADHHRQVFVEQLETQMFQS